MQTQQCSGARNLKFGLSHYLHPYFVQMDESICIQEMNVLICLFSAHKPSNAGTVYTMYHIFRLFILYTVVTL